MELRKWSNLSEVPQSTLGNIPIQQVLDEDPNKMHITQKFSRSKNKRELFIYWPPDTEW